MTITERKQEQKRIKSLLQIVLAFPNLWENNASLIELSKRLRCSVYSLMLIASCSNDWQLTNRVYAILSE